MPDGSGPGLWMPLATYERLCALYRELLEERGALIRQLDPTLYPDGPALACPHCGTTVDKHGKSFPNRSILSNHVRRCPKRPEVSHE